MRPNFIITGASSGLGQALTNLLRDYGPTLSIGGLDRSGACDWYCDLTDEYSCASVATEAEALMPPGSAFNVLVNCAGVNYIEWFEKLDWRKWDELMDLNAKAQALLTQKCLRWLTMGNEPGTVVNVVSNAAHVPMTNSVFYNASKAASHMVTLAMARELGKTHGLTIFGIAPNKMSGTGMSAYIERRVPELRGWSAEEAARYQASALPAGVETPPDVVAEFMAFLLRSKERHRYLHQTVIPYGG